MQISPPGSSGTDNSERPGAMAVRVGDRVRVRAARWVVTDVRPYERCALLTLSGLSAGNAGIQTRVLAPFDLVEPLPARPRLHIAGASKWRRACRELIALDGPAGILQTAQSARMDLLPHQLEPALAIVRGLGSRVLIADEVGLGKTIQAALVVAELAARGAAARVLVLAPAGLREQWADEFQARFGLRLGLFDTREVRRQQARLPFGVNPWSTEPMIVASIDYVKRPEVLPALRVSRWDIVIVDEAHHVAADSERHHAVASLCSGAAYVVLLTATPHSGDARAFASLCAIGEQQDALVVFRRTREDVGRRDVRRVHQLRVRPSDAERHMHACLARFIRAVRHEHGSRTADIWLAAATLTKRAQSSPFALARSVERRLQSLSGVPEPSDEQLLLPLDVAGELDAADAIPPWTIPALHDVQLERALLTRVLGAARQSLPHETKLIALKRLLRRLGEPAVVFTEYRDTLLHVRKAIWPGAAVIHGGLSRDERRTALTQFAAGQVLLATDAAGEGLNLHQNCRLVINLELPWNPMRLEQRIGRVDRIGQRRRVHVFHLIGAETGELRVLERLADRVRRAQMDVGAPDPLQSVHPKVVGTAPTVDLCRLGSEAAEEHDRLARARQLNHDRMDLSSVANETIGSDTLIRFAKRRTIRVQLQTRSLVLLQSTLVDNTGRTVASHLTPVLVRARHDIRRWLEELERIGSAIPDETYAGWLERSLAAHRAFWTRRLEREIAVAQAATRSEGTERQPGLFDRRAEHENVAHAQRRADAIEDADRQQKTARESGRLKLQPPRPVLVLVP